MGFGLTWIAQMIEGYATIIELAGGALMVWMGSRTFTSPPVPRCLDSGNDGESTNLVRAMVSTFALTVTNPVTLLSFGVMFAGLGGPGRRRGHLSRCRFCGRRGGGGLPPAGGWP